MGPSDYTILASSALAGLALVVAGGLSGWRGWLALKRSELEQAHPDQVAGAMPASSAGTRIEIADLRERIRKLEAIAAGVDL